MKNLKELLKASKTALANMNKPLDMSEIKLDANIFAQYNSFPSFKN